MNFDEWRDTLRKDPLAAEKILDEQRNQGKEFVVYHEGLLFASVCSSLGKEETEQRMSGVLCGTTGGWMFSDQDFEEGKPNPVPCNEWPETHLHYLFVC